MECWLGTRRRALSVTPEGQLGAGGLASQMWCGGDRAGDEPTPPPTHTTAAGFRGAWLTDRNGRGCVGVTGRGDSRENILQGVKGRKCASSGESAPQKRNSHSPLGRPLTRPVPLLPLHPPAPGPETLVVGWGRFPLKTKPTGCKQRFTAQHFLPKKPLPRADITRSASKELQPFPVQKGDQQGPCPWDGSGPGVDVDLNDT